MGMPRAIRTKRSKCLPRRSIGDGLSSLRGESAALDLPLRPWFQAQMRVICWVSLMSDVIHCIYAAFHILMQTNLPIETTVAASSVSNGTLDMPTLKEIVQSARSSGGISVKSIQDVMQYIEMFQPSITRKLLSKLMGLAWMPIRLEPEFMMYNLH